MRGFSRSGATLQVIALALLLSLGFSAVGSAMGTPATYKVGSVTWHAKKFAGQNLLIVGYVLRREAGYVLFSDEPTGAVSAHDLPVAGLGIEQLSITKKYLLSGKFVEGGLAASNGNLYHLELAAAPVLAP